LIIWPAAPHRRASTPLDPPYGVKFGSNFGANKGILITLAAYGPEAHAFANGTPLVLLDGANLLHLLEKHGYKTQIDLLEARKIAMSQPSR
jgi:hypothetical protein